jgi:hypothetical protein
LRRRKQPSDASPIGRISNVVDSGPDQSLADAGYYGQPTGSMPTTQTGSIFFVDVVFEED